MIELTNDNFETVVATSPLPLIIDFWATWCGPCKKFMPLIESLAIQYANKITIVKANVDQNSIAVDAYGIKGIPALMFFRDGKELGIAVGATTEQKINDNIQKFFGDV